jgi:Cell wall-active antibiotics response LiaF, C-terminal
MTARIGLGVVLLAAGGLWLLSAADIVDIPYRVSLGMLLIAIGLLIALTPGRHGLLVVVGILVALAGVPAFFVDADVWTTGVGAETAAPASRDELEPFEQAVGKLTVDLTTEGLELDDETVEARLGIGELLVLVPTNTDVSIDAHAGAGNIQALGEEENGFDVDLTGISGTSGAQEVELELEIGIGNIRVELPG